MHKLTIFPIGNADTLRIDLDNGRKILIDYADLCDRDNASDRRIDLPLELRRDLDSAGQGHYDTVVFTHIDSDHVTGASEFFFFEHAEKYQSENRIRIGQMWVPAAAILETGATSESRIIRQEARHRLVQGHGIRVYSSPGILDDWLLENGIDPADRHHLITDAGTVVPEYQLSSDGVEFFVHSPFASRTDSMGLVERNRDAITLHATFVAGSRSTSVLLFSDVAHDVIREIVSVTEHHGRYDRLAWDVAKLPHHCSYLSLGPEKGVNVTSPVEEIGRLYGDYGREHPILVSSSDPIPVGDSDQPPHRQAAAYYREVAHQKGGEFLVSMEFPTPSEPAPIVIHIDDDGAMTKREIAGGVGVITSMPAPRAG